MESGQLDSSGVSQKVLNALAKLLHASVSELEEAADFRGIAGPRPTAVYMRSDLSIAQAAPSAPATDRSPDEVDRRQQRVRVGLLPAQPHFSDDEAVVCQGHAAVRGRRVHRQQPHASSLYSGPVSAKELGDASAVPA
jgi:hypothetical protein